jgi:hypothetical protein
LGCLAQQQAPPRAIVVPAGAKVAVAVISPVWTDKARLGYDIYGVTTSPVTIANEMAIPPGTYVKGRVDIMTLTGLSSNRAEFRMQFTQIAFADGSAVDLSDQAFATVNVRAYPRSDLYLDNGTQIEMVFDHPLTLDSEKVAAAARLSRAPDIAQWKSASRCREYPVTPGVPNTTPPYMGPPPPTYAPGTPGGPPIYIPPPPGTLLPGTPPASGAPPPGTPLAGMPAASGAPGGYGWPCPPPVVLTKLVVHKESFSLSGPARVDGQQLASGTYQVRWEGLGPSTDVQIQRKGKVVTVQARVVALGHTALTSGTTPRTNPDGSVSLESVQFGDRTFGLRFD